jgi:hypothetical protein
MSFFDRKGNGACNGGEGVRPALQIRLASGALANLSGRDFVYLIMVGETELHRSTAVPDGPYRVVADLPGSTTFTMTGKVRHYFAERTAAGRRDWIAGDLTISRRAATLLSGAAPGLDTYVVDERGVATVETSGAPGLPASAELGFSSPEDMREQLIDAPVDAAVERSDAAAGRADEATDLLSAMVGEQLPILAALLIPPGATLIAADSANVSAHYGVWLA